MQNPLAAHRGTYRGLSPTSQSAIAMGEAEVVIADNHLDFSMATGTVIQGYILPTDDFVPMTAEELAAQYKEGCKVLKSITGFKGADGYPILLFFNEGRLAQGFVMWTGGMRDMLGPTMMNGPSRLSRLACGVLTWLVDRKTKGGIPRFRYDGKARRYA